MVFPVDLTHHTLVMVGFVSSDGSHTPLYELQSRLAARVISGNHKLPSREVMMADVDKWNAFIKAKFSFYKYQVGNIYLSICLPIVCVCVCIYIKDKAVSYMFLSQDNCVLTGSLYNWAMVVPHPLTSYIEFKWMDSNTVIIRKLYVTYVTQSSGIRQDVHIRCRYARHTLEVRYSYAINTLVVRYCTVAVRYIFMPTYGNVCPPYLTYE